MKIFIAGIGPGNPDLITLEALASARSSDVIIVPRSRLNTEGAAEKIIKHHMPDKELIPVLFPMINDEAERNAIILSQLTKTRSRWGNSRTIFFPVIGDAMLFSTGAYFLEAMRKLADVDAEFIPGISAHSLAAVCAKKFLAMSDEILSIIPGTANPDEIMETLKHSHSAAIYKPKALSNIREIITSTGPYAEILRVDFAGTERERVLEGISALDDIHEYLTIILLWKN